ncbi:MAG: putative Helicase domain-containing protein [Promethearchaeota archaeon]|nr:MAG: putative Helicase domain-containing protein [Candidatus Lokiarchaeota archaeon]
MTQITDRDHSEELYLCPFCGNVLDSRFSKCFNIYCRGKDFHIENLVIYRLNPELGIGKIIQVIEVPSSRTLDEEDSFIIKKFKILFKNNIIKIVNAVDLIHYIFAINETIYSDIEKKYGIINSQDISIEHGQIAYEVLYSNGMITQIYESEILLWKESLADKIDLSILNPPESIILKYWASLFYSYYTSHYIKCINNSRLSLMSHQINVAHRLVENYFPRMILADEVGLGKTIEAGIYIKEMRARNIAERILLIVPASLVNQWRFELENKFHLKFLHFDGKKIKVLKKRGSYTHPNLLHNPFYYENLIICSLQFARNPKYCQLLSQISWDIVIFDEAHHLRRYLVNKSTESYRETLNYKLARTISQSTQSLLLLTATPLQLHSFELYSLIELIHPEAFENFSDFEHFRKNIPYINLLIKNLSQLDHLNTFEVTGTIRLLKELNYIKNSQSNTSIIRLLKNNHYKETLLEKIEEDHTLAKFLIRNRKKHVISDEYITKRIVKTITVIPKDEELNIYNEIRLYLAKIYNLAGDTGNKNIGLGFVITTLQKLLTSSKYAFLRSIEKRVLTIKELKNDDPDYFDSDFGSPILESETIEMNNGKANILSFENQEKILKEFYQKLKEITYDSKSETMVDLVGKLYRNNPSEKILIFTQFIDTLYFLKKTLEEANPSYSINLFYGGLTKEQKARAVRRFRNYKGFSILLSTEIGGEGRNFQFCRILINYDLPWNPMKLEQRIGRLDRIGQKSENIYVYNLFMEGTIETDIIFALSKRINLFKESIGDLEPILGNIEEDIKQLIFTLDTYKTDQISQFNRNLENKAKKAKEMQLKLDDLLIDKKSFQRNPRLEEITQPYNILTDEMLYNFIRTFFASNSEFGAICKIKATQKEGNNGASIELVQIEVNKTLSSKINGTLDKEYIGTFNLEIARAMEEIDFFALGHPLINGIIQYCTKENFLGNYSILTIDKSSLPKNFLRELQITDTNTYYLYVFELTFQGFIVEQKIIPMLLDEKGNYIDKIPELLLDPGNPELFSKYLIKEHKLKNQTMNIQTIEKCFKKASEKVKKMEDQWKKKIIKINNIIFQNEKKKQQKLYQYKRKVFIQKLESLKTKLKVKKTKFPSENVLSKIQNMSDEKKKQKRLLNIKSLKEEIKFLKKDIISTQKKIDDFKFHYLDLKNDMKKQNLQKFSEELIVLATVYFKS